MSTFHPYLPFGNLAKQAELATALTPLVVSNLVRPNPEQGSGQSSTHQPTTPLDMAPSPHLTPTEQALGASPEQLQMQEDHTRLQDEHGKLQRQLEDAKRQAAIAKDKASLPAATAPATPNLDDYKSMQMEMMAGHLADTTAQLKGIAQEASAMPMQLKTACALRLVDLALDRERLKRASDNLGMHPPIVPAAPPTGTTHPEPTSPTSLSPRVQQQLNSGQIHGGGANTLIDDLQDQHRRTQMLGVQNGPTPTGWAGFTNTLGGMWHAGLNSLEALTDGVDTTINGTAPNPESQANFTALTNTMTPDLDRAATIASTPAAAVHLPPAGSDPKQWSLGQLSQARTQSELSGIADQWNHGPVERLMQNGALSKDGQVAIHQGSTVCRHFRCLQASR